jgi:hypothetical protein
VKKSKERLVIEALDRIFGKTVRVIVSDGKIIKWMEPSEVQPTTEQIQSVIEEILLEEPMKALREERDMLLNQCDWRMTTDYPHDDQLAWKEYRSRLRDVPSLVAEGNLPTPNLNEEGELIFDHFPAPPNS